MEIMLVGKHHIKLTDESGAEGTGEMTILVWLIVTLKDKAVVVALGHHIGASGLKPSTPSPSGPTPYKPTT